LELAQNVKISLKLTIGEEEKEKLEEVLEIENEEKFEQQDYDKFMEKEKEEKEREQTKKEGLDEYERKPMKAEFTQEELEQKVLTKFVNYCLRSTFHTFTMKIMSSDAYSYNHYQFFLIKYLQYANHLVYLVIKFSFLRKNS
jgi:hypothetical protein